MLMNGANVISVLCARASTVRELLSHREGRLFTKGVLSPRQFNKVPIRRYSQSVAGQPSHEKARSISDACGKLVHANHIFQLRAITSLTKALPSIPTRLLYNVSHSSPRASPGKHREPEQAHSARERSATCPGPTKGAPLLFGSEACQEDD